jgi:hypothetical protein
LDSFLIWVLGFHPLNEKRVSFDILPCIIVSPGNKTERKLTHPWPAYHNPRFFHGGRWREAVAKLLIQPLAGTAFLPRQREV